MTWTAEEFAKMREDRARWLTEIASLEAGNPPLVTRREYGVPVDDTAEHLAHLKRNVADTESILNQNDEPIE